MVDGLQLELKIPVVLGKLAGQNDPGDEQQQRRHHGAAADDERGEPGHQPGGEKFHKDGGHKQQRQQRQNARQNTEELEGPVVFVQPGDGAQHLEPVREGVQLALGAFGAVPVFDDDVVHLHVAVQGVDGHFGLDLKAAGQHRVGLDELVAERPVAGHNVLDLAAEQVVGAEPHQIVAEIVEGPLVLGVVGGGKPVPHHHIGLMLGDKAHHLRRGLGGVGVVPVHQNIRLGVDFPEHPPHDAALALLVFPAHHRARLLGQRAGAVGGVVVVHIDGGLRQHAAEIRHHLLHRFCLVVTGDQNSDFIHIVHSCAYFFSSSSQKAAVRSQLNFSSTSPAGSTGWASSASRSTS